jgi:glycosyltransferase involved in cell wall biosynthesis
MQDSENSLRQPLVSIIMPTYNRAHLIQETIESIRQQTHANWELIIGDDGSEDNTEEMVLRFNDTRIQFYKEGQVGIDEIRSRCIQKAKGNFIAFMDSDDLWAPEKLEKQLKAFTANPDAGFCMTGGYNFRRVNEPLDHFYPQKEGFRYGNLFDPFFKSEIAAMPPTLVFKKNCLETAQFSSKAKIAHVEFILNLARNFNGVLLYEPLFYRRIHDTNYSTLNRIKRHHDGVEMIRQYKNALPKKTYQDSLFRSHLRFGEECLNLWDRRRAIQEFLRAWKYKPWSVIPLKKISKAILSLV